MNSASFKLPPAGTLISMGLLLILMTGCTVGPKYLRPPVAAPTVYRGADEAPVSSADQESLGDQKWVQVFHEPE
jgi:multidrug efflux system outer membrane protein